MTKPTKWCVPSEDSDQPGHAPSLIRVFAVRMKKAWVHSYPLSTQQRLINQTGWMPRLIWSSLGAQSFCFLSWGSSIIKCCQLTCWTAGLWAVKALLAELLCRPGILGWIGLGPGPTGLQGPCLWARNMDRMVNCFLHLPHWNMSSSSAEKRKLISTYRNGNTIC